MKFSVIAALLLPVLALAQNSAPNGIKNGTFERYSLQENLWAGVDGSGFLAGYPQGVDAFLEGGPGRLNLAASVQVADLNGDGLLDILMVDGKGYFRVFFNSGTKTEPKFTTCEMVPLFARRVKRGPFNVENGFHACLVDFAKRGAMDILVGDYWGRLMLFKNTGSAMTPEWRQPTNIEGVLIPTTKDGHVWANLLAPAVWDWNGDGRQDILLGEGSYSANSVHLLLNNGSNSAPQFNMEGQDYLLFGEGREQLVPAVVDWNGDGLPDLLVGDRKGDINVYISKGPWKKGVQMERLPEPVKFGSATPQPNNGNQCVCPAVADLNGDGLFDIILGDNKGHVWVSYNIGTKTEPKFGPLVELKGERPPKQTNFNIPADWEIAFGLKEGNVYGYHACVSPQDDPEAAGSKSPRVLKFGYSPSPNKLIRRQPMPMPSCSAETTDYPITYRGEFRPDGSSWEIWYNIEDFACDLDSNTALARTLIGPNFLKPGTNFKLSFRVKGHGVSNGRIHFTMAGWLIKDPKKDGNAPGNWITDHNFQEDEFSVTSNWTEVTKTINIRFENETDLNKPDRWKGAKIDYRGMLEILSNLEPDTGAFLIDDVRLTPM